jgi:hypothetical protein
MHIVGTIVGVLVAIDLFFGTVRILRATRRQRAVDPSGASVIETAAHYSRRMLRAIMPPVLILVVLVLGFLAIVHFGPLKPIHEW